MPIKSKLSSFILSESSLFHHNRSQIQELLQYQRLIIENYFVINGKKVMLLLYSQILKLTFLAPVDEKQSIPLYLKLNYDIKAAQITSHHEALGNKIIGFSLFKYKNHSYDFECHDDKIVIKWIDQLSKIIFLSGFSNNFKAVKYIAKGQFAQVWQMQRLRDRKKFAVKIIDKEVCFGQAKGKEAVYNQIQILKKLNHPNIQHIECIFEQQKNLYLVLQYIPGFVLSDLVSTKSTESKPAYWVKKINNINIMKNLLNALKYIHDMGIAHRDIKPANIIINPADNWKPYLIDFGLSEFTSKQQFMFQFSGSPGYMAPQIFTDREFLELQKCDIFSLGAIFYLLLARKPLFDGNSTEQIYRQMNDSKKIMNKKIQILNSEAQANLIRQMLRQNPNQRLTTQQALSHEYFTEASYNYLSELRKPKSDGEKTISFLVEQRKFKCRFEELFSQSAVYMGFKLNLIKKEDEENTNTSQNTSLKTLGLPQKLLQKQQTVQVYLSQKKTFK